MDGSSGGVAIDSLSGLSFALTKGKRPGGRKRKAKALGESDRPPAPSKPNLAEGGGSTKTHSANEINPYRNMSDENLLGMVDNWNRYLTQELPSQSSKISEFLCKVFEIRPNVFSVVEVEAHVNMVLGEITCLWKECTQRQLTGNTTEQTIALGTKLGAIVKKIQEARHYLTSEAAMRSCSAEVPTEISRLMSVSLEQHYSDAELTSGQKLLQYLLAITYHHNYRKMGEGMGTGTLYYEVVSENGQGMHYWEELCSIREFIYRQCDKETHFEMWQLLGDPPRNIDTVERFLTEGFDKELPRLVPDRFWFSYQNGIYSIKLNKFFPYGHPDIPHGVVSHRLFKESFDIEAIQAANGNPWAVPTPAFDRVLKTQKLGAEFSYTDTARRRYFAKKGEAYYIRMGKMVENCDEDGVLSTSLVFTNSATEEELGYETEEQVRADGWTPITNLNPLRMLLAMMGRMLYPLHEDDRGNEPTDGWQKVAYILGKAGNGKSTISNIIRYWFNPKDVGILNSNCEEQWALSGIYDRMVWLCNEVRSDFKLDTGSFQSMVCGESTTINIKNKNPTDQPWNSPGLLLGNQLPRKWTDGQGSITRRILLFRFLEIPDAPDPALFDKLKAEMSRIIYKCNSIYRQVRDGLEAKSTAANPMTIESILSPYFKNTNDHLANETNSLLKFLRLSEKLKFGSQEKEYCKMRDLIAEYKLYCVENNYRARAFTEEFFDVPFRAKNLRVDDSNIQNYGNPKGPKVKARRVFGVSIKRDVQGEESMTSLVFN